MNNKNTLIKTENNQFQYQAINAEPTIEDERVLAIVGSVTSIKELFRL